MTELATLETEIIEAIDNADSEEKLNEVRVKAVGKKGKISELLKSLGSLTPEDRKTKGEEFNELKTRINNALSSRQKTLSDLKLEAKLVADSIDISLPVRLGSMNEGRVHPVSQVIDELTAIFADMGFAIAEGPDIETDYYNFTALNFPENHPAREMHDTFFFPKQEDGTRKVLRTHTSPVQIRTMKSQEPPIRVMIPGRTYRCDSDQTHTPMFHQVEGLVIDKSTHIGHLKWTLEVFCKTFFEVQDVRMRFRPSFFPFTEPSLEVDVGCSFEDGEVRIGEGDKWLEILGCGMVHPKVLRNCELDPDVFQGFAFGLGIDRLGMLKYGMSDLRGFFNADIRWLKHYGVRPLDIPTLFSGLSS